MDHLDGEFDEVEEDEAEEITTSELIEKLEQVRLMLGFDLVKKIKF